jgi:FkbM family methyltransferase
LPLAWTCEGALPHYGADLPSKLLTHAAALRQVAALWADDVSREVFRRQLLWRLRGIFLLDDAPTGSQYFPQDLIRPLETEVFVDGGAFDGDTLRRIPWLFKKAFAFEPDPLNAAKLRAQADRRIQIHQTALGNAPGRTRFDATGTTASSRSVEGVVEVQVSTLDELLAAEFPTFVKLDIEGDELSALMGGVDVLRRCQPTVAVCLYHRPEDLWTIPLFLRETLPNHRFFLRIHEYDGFELVVYAVPPDRCA